MLDVVGVAVADEVIALLAVLGPQAAAAAQHPGHRLAHAAADVADDAAPLDLAAGLGQRGAQGVAEGEVAQVADVQRLGRVGVPEVEREAAVAGDVGVGARLGSAGLEGSALLLDPAVGKPHPGAIAVALHGVHPRLAFELLQRLARGVVVAPLRHPRHQHHVVAVVRPERGPQSPETFVPVPSRSIVKIVEDVVHRQRLLLPE